MRIVCIVWYGCLRSVSPKRRESSGEANPDTGHHATQADTHVGRWSLLSNILFRNAELSCGAAGAAFRVDVEADAPRR